MESEKQFTPWGARSVPFIVFSWAMGIILIIVGILFNLISQGSARDEQLNTRITSVLDGQADIKDQLIRLDERQQSNIANVQKILNKLNIQ